MNRFTTLVVSIAIIVGSVSLSQAEDNLMGEQDFADGASVGANSTWLTAQANEPAPFNILWVAPTTISWTHSGISSVGPAVLTFSLWDLDNMAAGNQISAFFLDGTAQPIDVFEIPAPNFGVTFYQFLVDSTLLSDGSLTISIVLGPDSPGNEVGVDFSLLSITPLKTITSNDAATALSVSGPLSSQLATLNAGPPPFDPATWLPVNRRSHANPPPQSTFRCDCTGVPPALGCDAILRADPLAEVFVAADQHLTSVDEVTLDNCGSAFYRFTFTMPPSFLNPILSGSANVDDEAVLFLNGHRISAALTNPGCDPNPVNGAGDPCYGMQDVGMDRVDGQGLPVLTWPTLDSFQTADPTFFVPGENELVFAVAGDASFFEPTGVEFTASINFDCAGATFATTGDIAGFIGVLLNGPFTVNELCLADMNRDGLVNAADIQLFVNAMLGL